MFAKILRFCLFCVTLTFVRWKVCAADVKNSDKHALLQAIHASSVVNSVSDISTVSLINYFTDDQDLNKKLPSSPWLINLNSKVPRKQSLTSIPANTEVPDNSRFIPTATVSVLASGLETSEKIIAQLSYNSKIQSANQVQFVPFGLTHHTSLLPNAHLLPNTNPKSPRMLNNLKALPPDIITTSPISTMENHEGHLAIRATPVMASSRIESSNSAEGLESNASLERDITAVPNHTRSISQTINVTNPVRVEKRTNSHTMVIVPAVIGVISVLSIGVMAALYQWHQRGRRRKVYLSHPGAPPKDFAEDTGVRSPVLLPEEIEMQVGRSQSLRVRRAVILATDSIVVEPESTSAANVDNHTLDTTDDSVANNTSTPPPPPYREPPPYLPDMVIENIHAL